MTLKLRFIEFTLPDWSDKAFNGIREAEKKLTDIAGSAGKGSTRFQDTCSRLGRAANQGESALLANINEPIEIRALTYILSVPAEKHTAIMLTEIIIKRMGEIKNPMSRLSLMQLIRAFFFRFDNLASPPDLRALITLIQDQLRTISTGKQGGLSTYASASSLVFSEKGPAKLAEKAQKEAIDLDVLFKRLSLTGLGESRYLTLARCQYYLRTLETLPINQSHSILSEICKKEVFTTPLDENRLVGHGVLEIIIDRSKGSVIHTDWRNAILAIAGDPRVPKSAENYQRWWSLLGEERVALMRGWLSRFDLKLFLSILEQSARDSGERDMERMFAPRKKFMEGLLEEGVIVESRLFLSTYATRYLKQRYKKEDLPAYARVRSSRTSMIYLNIKNKVYLVEGSHSFPIKIFNKLAPESRLPNYNIDEVTDEQLRNGEMERFHRAYGLNGCLSQTHRDLIWQNSVLQFMKSNGVLIRAAKVIRSESYRAYKEKFGSD
ncbi:EH signature domain-containing protein [Hahella sp. NBU794]|uniref:EH signature domain-containing protein n=1 Tax=Hahella sp. NBU794 TaxID=3422590 RepID=UPI003D6DE4DD